MTVSIPEVTTKGTPAAAVETHTLRSGRVITKNGAGGIPPASSAQVNHSGNAPKKGINKSQSPN